MDYGITRFSEHLVKIECVLSIKDISRKAILLKTMRTKKIEPSWKMSNGDYIDIKDMSNIHLVNTIKLIRRLAKKGITFCLNYSFGDGENFMDGDVTTIKGKKVFNYFEEYKYMLKEAKKRKLKIV